MKKTKYLALTLVVAIMMMGAGYAYWSETLTIENTITTGELDFTFQNEDLISISEWMDFDGVSSIGVNSSNDNQVDIVLEDMYPGAEATVYFELLNSGTMKAKVKDFAVSDFAEKAYFNVKDLKVNGVNKGDVALTGLAAKLNSLNIQIEPGAKVAFEVTLQVEPTATEAEVAENLDAIMFELTAAGLQYNDPN